MEFVALGELGTAGPVDVASIDPDVIAARARAAARWIF